MPATAPPPRRPFAFPTEPPTSEAAWRALIGGAPELDDLVAARVVVLAPHPDDETLAVGGLIGVMAQSAIDVRVVSVTDGEASHPGVAGLAARRRREQEQALARLGAPQAVDRLGLPDGRVRDHHDHLVDVLVDRVRDAEVLVAPWRHDGHPDHDAVGEAARIAAAATGVRLLSYPVWLWQWAAYEDVTTLPLRRWSVPCAIGRRKAAAVACFGSQTSRRHGTPILSPLVVARAARPWEVLIDERSLCA